MRAAPPFALTLTPLPWGPRAYPVLAGAAAAVALAWALAMFAPDAVQTAGWFRTAVAAAAVLSLAIGCCVAWVQPHGEAAWLAWDGNRWTVGPQLNGPNTAAMHGALDVMVDIGEWLLLRIRPDAAPAWAAWRFRWLLTRLPDSAESAAMRATLYAHRESEEPIAARWPL